MIGLHYPTKWKQICCQTKKSQKAYLKYACDTKLMLLILSLNQW